MNDLLRALLPALEVAARRALRPEHLDLVIVHNTGPIPPVRPPAVDTAGEPGFNVIVAERGRPIYFCKCRPAGDPALAHEGTIGEILAREPATATHVAAMHFARGPVMDVLVVRSLAGRPYHELLVKQRENEWLSSVELVMGLVERMSTRVAAALPALCGPAKLRLADEGRWALAALREQQGVGRRQIEALATALEQGGQVTSQPQHGDLWPPNVLVNGRSWYILDLELFGRVRVPLYDLLHMLHICSHVRRGDVDRRTWVERLVTGDQLEAGARRLVRRTAERHGLSPAATFGAVVYYVIDMTARVRARGAWSADWREYVAEAARLGDLVADGSAAADRLFMTDRE